MSDQGTPARDTAEDKDLDAPQEVSEQNREEQPGGESDPSSDDEAHAQDR